MNPYIKGIIEQRTGVMHEATEDTLKSLELKHGIWAAEGVRLNLKLNSIVMGFGTIVDSSTPFAKLMLMHLNRMHHDLKMTIVAMMASIPPKTETTCDEAAKDRALATMNTYNLLTDRTVSTVSELTKLIKKSEGED